MTVKDIPVVDRALKKEFKAHNSPIIELIEAQTHDPFGAHEGSMYGGCRAASLRESEGGGVPSRGS